MSDDEYYSDNNSDNSDSDVEPISSKKPLFNIAIKKVGGASSSNNYDDSDLIELFNGMTDDGTDWELTDEFVELYK
jgi:hypothetical protein